MRLTRLFSGATISIVNATSIVGNRPPFPQVSTFPGEINLLGTIFPLKRLSFHLLDLAESLAVVWDGVGYVCYTLMS